MDQNGISPQTPAMRDLLKSLGIFAEVVELYRQHDRFTEYLVDGKYVLRLSESELPEQKKNIRVNSLPFVSKIHSSGPCTVFGNTYHYLLFDYIHGGDLWSAAPRLTKKEQYIIGMEIALFLNELHSIAGDFYDIGHYIPTIPQWKKTWREGHIEYAAILENGLSKIGLEAKNQKTISKAFDFIRANMDALDYAAGAKLLHNDFHPKNIIVHEGRLTGVVDWECSQFGEADFELSRLFDWCVYPDSYLCQTNNLDTLLKSVVEHLRFASAIPDMDRRMTVYQLEHELNQLVWNGKNQEEERMVRINGWLDGKIDILWRTNRWKI